MKPKSTVSPSSADRDSGISRRGFIQGIVVLSTTTAALGGLPADAPAADLAEALPAGAFPGKQPLLALVLNRIIPEDGTMPAAGDLGVGAFIDQAAKASPQLRSSVSQVLGTLPEAEAFSRLSETEAERLLHEVEDLHGHAFELLIQTTYAGYYGHSAVQRTLGWVDPIDAGVPQVRVALRY